MSLPSSFIDVKDIIINSCTIAKVYYNNFLVYEKQSGDVIESVITNGIWEDESLWNNEDLFTNLI